MEDKVRIVKAIVEGGRATGGPPLGPALGPLGVNIGLIVDRINELTKIYAGLRVPVEIAVNVEDKSFDVRVGTPTTAALIAQEAKIEKGSSAPGGEGGEPVGDISIDQVIRIAKRKREQLYAKDLRAAVRTVLGSCLSIGVTVEGRDPREVQREVEGGRYDELIGEA
ncbi:MAG: 50S ribosomal protein L11 [Candidatus Bathyarchaeia archaeon]